jgi:hypothetical protein
MIATRSNESAYHAANNDVMAAHWRQLLDDIGVEWRDRGRNCSRGHININCPFCYDDPSFHCTISETEDVYFCYRDNRHSGSAMYLLQRLLGSRVKAVNVLEDYADNHPIEIRAPVAKLIKFDTFDMAFESQGILDYLALRGFKDPELTCRRFNLRYAQAGAYANRVLMPLIDQDGNIQSFVGRAIRDNMQPAYKAANPDLIHNLVYGSLTGKIVIIVEGPFDALKINSALYDRMHEMSCVALTGRVLTASRKRILALQERRCVLALDRDVPAYAVFETLNRLRKDACLSVERVTLPNDYQDPGEMDEAEVVKWIERDIVCGLCGEEPSKAGQRVS